MIRRPCSSLCALILALLIVALCGCDLRAVAHADQPTPATPVQAGAALPESTKDLEVELKAVRARERLLVGALDDARTDAIQTRLWLGSGACFLACLVLVAIGIWTSRRLLIELGVVAGGLGGLCIFAAWLAPYALAIGIAIGVLAVAIAVWMLVNRQRGLEQVTAGVDELKQRVPDYAAIMRQHIDTGADRLIDHVRKTRPKA